MGINAVRLSTLVSFLSCMLSQSTFALGHFYSLTYDRVEEDINAFKRFALSPSKHPDKALGCCGDFRYDLQDVDGILNVAQDLATEDRLAKPVFDIDADNFSSPCTDITPYADAAKNELRLSLLIADDCIKDLKNTPRRNNQSLSNSCQLFYMHRDAYIALRDIVVSVMHVCESDRALPFMDIKGEYTLITSDNPGKRCVEEGYCEEECVNNRLDSSSPIGDFDGPLVSEGANSPGEDPPREPRGGKNPDDGNPPSKKGNGKIPNGGDSGGRDDDAHGEDDDEQRRKRNGQTLDYYLKNYQFINYRPETSGYHALHIYATGLTVVLLACVL